MRTPYRKTSIVRAVDLRDRRQRAGLTADRLAVYLELADGKHVSAIELGKCTITMERAIRAAYVLGGITVELPGLGMAAVVALRQSDASVQHVVCTNLRPGEAAWIAVEEAREAIDSLQELQSAVMWRDRPALVRLYEQIVCDPTHAAGLVAAAIDEFDPTIGPEATINHAKKLMLKGIQARQYWPVRQGVAM